MRIIFDITQVKEGLSLNEQYNTRNAVSLIPNERLQEIQSDTSKPKIQQKPFVHILLESSLGRYYRVACRTLKPPHHHPNEHTPDELKLIRDMQRRNPQLGITVLWHRLRRRGYTRRVESLYRVLKRLPLLPPAAAKLTYKPKPYEQMTRPGERIQLDVKFVPLRCLANKEQKLYQYTAIDEFTWPGTDDGEPKAPLKLSEVIGESIRSEMV